MTAFDAQNEDRLPGSSLRNEAANYLSAMYGPGKTEILIAGKKVDGLFAHEDLGSRETVVLEAKDHGGPLHRQDLVDIWSDYEPVLRSVGPAKLLVVSRKGLAPGAQAYVDSQPGLRHLTIWELENQVLGLRPYVSALTALFDEDGLSQYYIPGRAQLIRYSGDMVEAEEAPTNLADDVAAWLNSEDSTPIAILGGYGAGKSSFARWLVSTQAKTALADPTARRPVLIRLGGLARYSDLEGILGSMFTSQHTVQGYNFHRFMEFNAKGRFLVLLDGFDEMKHAMSFSEFRSQIREFNSLITPGSKVVLLGRPSAFTTDAEHHFVLKGRVPAGDSWRKLQDWPEFQEYRLIDFAADERELFITGFLRHQASKLASRTGEVPGHGWVEARAREVSELAATDPSVFGRPVHLKILAELASDPEHDFTRLRRSLTRWSLYDEFFRALAQREADKAARNPIGEGARLEFLRELAFWLWQERSSATSVVAAAIPEAILNALPDGGADELEDKRREYLAGAFLERKPGDIYYFPHRSFAEFLVASRMLAHPPSSSQHSAYGALATEGVLEFLLTPENAPKVRRWADTLAGAQGSLQPSYIQTLLEAFGGPNELIAAIPSTYWTLPVRLLGRRLRIHENFDALRDALLKARVPELALGMQLIDPNGMLGFEQRGDDAQLSATIAAVLLERVLRAVRENPPSDTLTIEGEADEQMKLLAVAGITSLGQGRSGRVARLDWGGLAAAARRTSLAYGVAIDWQGPFESTRHAPRDIPFDQLMTGISPEFRQRAQSFLYRLTDLRNVVVVVSRRRLTAPEPRNVTSAPSRGRLP